MGTTTRTKVLEKVGALLAKAEGSEFGPERDAFRAKADQLMLDWAIEHSEIIRREGRNLKDEVVRRVITIGPEGQWMTDFLRALAWRITRHARCEGVFHPGYTHPDGGGLPLTFSIVGMQADVDYVEMLFTSLRLEIANTLEPQYDHSKSLAENIVTMRNAGLKWELIDVRCTDAKPAEPTPRLRAERWLRIYEEECERQGIEPRKRINPKMVQRNFVDGFVTEVTRRLSDMKRQQEQQAEGASTALVPVTNAVKERFDELFPNTTLSSGSRASGKFDPTSFGRGKAAGSRANLGQPGVRNRRALEA